MTINRRSNRENDRQDGAALVIVVALLVAMTSVGIVYLESATAEYSLQQVNFQRFSARSIAEGGVDAAYTVLKIVPGIVGTYHYDLPGGQLDIKITATPHGYQIVSFGTVAGLHAGMVSAAEGGAAIISVRETFLVGAELKTAGTAALEWGGKAYYDQVSVGTNSEMLGDKQKLSVLTPRTPVMLNSALFMADATSTLPGGSTLATGNLTGNAYCPGNLTVHGNLVLDGTLFVNGDLTIQSAGSITISPGDSATALLVKGDLVIKDVAKIDLLGSVFVEKGVKITDVVSFTGVGSVALNDTFEVFDSTVLWQFDPAIVDNPPRYVSGGFIRQELRQLYMYPTMDLSLVNP